MHKTRPLSHLFTESLHSLPWTRSSIALGRPYRPYYRFRAYNSDVQTASSKEFLTAVPTSGSSEQHNAAKLNPKSDDCDLPIAPRGVVTQRNQSPFSEVDLSRQPPARNPRTKRRKKDFSLLKHWLVTSDDRCLDFGYETRVAQEKEQIQGRTANEVYNVLRVAASEGTVASLFKIQACFNHLVKDFGEKPNTRLYSALILANCRADGSVAEVQRLLDEMEIEGVEVDSGVCHDVLKVLSVHPDYLLRTQVLEYMKTRWYSLTDTGHQDIVAGLIREGQLELAMERIESLKNNGTRILGWVYDMVVYALVDRGELDDVFQTMRMRVADGDVNISSTLWYYLLDISARALHYDLASFIWRTRVQTSHLNPASGICTYMMTIAQRHSDVELVQQVFNFLANRDTTFDASHYEMVLDTYVNAGVPEHSFYVLSAMQKANVIPTRGSTRRVYANLKLNKQKDNLRAIYDLVQSLKEDGSPIPVAAVNVLIEAASHHKLYDFAIEMYRAIPETCVTGPNLDTFNTLLQLCKKRDEWDFSPTAVAEGEIAGEATKLTAKQFAFSLAAEMVAAQIVPDALAYDRMMLICLLEGSHNQKTAVDSLGSAETQPFYEDGIRYYSEMRAKGFEPRFGTAMVLVRVLTQAADERVWAVLEDLEGMAMPIATRKLKEWVSAHLGKSGGRGELSRSEFGGS